ncbi:hypothetical protein [Epilithonimonas sp. UC225_85]|uniref:hypothetical protein n=1 Tax=Epilithonimonas sp. UC225_85 TaxID=3350167 RepID=UPI0036D3B6B0
MKKINHINQYLLERYPNIWNTRIVWMLLLGLAIHIIFFFIGFVSHANPGTLQHTRAVDDYLLSGLVYVHVIISLLMIVGWLVFMLKNNAFKSFYPSSGRKLFFEFLQYFIIIFVSTTFYFSYMSGFKLFINYKYDDEKMEKNIGLINLASPFLSQELELYTLENRHYPKPFSDYYCETDINKIDKNEKYFVYHDSVYQYFNIYKKVVKEHNKEGEFIYPEEERKHKTALAYFENSIDGKSRTYYFKKNVEDLSAYIQSTAPSYYNYSEVFYNIKSNPYLDSYRSGDIVTTLDEADYKKQQISINQKTAEILDGKKTKELEKLLQNFLDISNEFGIRNNLNVKGWTAIVNHPDKFEVKNFIKKYRPEHGKKYDPNKAADGYYNDQTEIVETAASEDNYLNENGEVRKDTVNVKDFNPNVDKEVSPADYFEKNMTDYYFYSYDLKLVLENIDMVKSNDFFTETVHIFIWIAFALAAFVFSFRVTNLRSLLFSIVSSGMLILVVTLFCVAVGFIFNISNFFILYTILTVGIFILLVPFITINRFSKLFSSIFMIITIITFPLFVLLILGIINEYQTFDCRMKSQMSGDYESCKGVFEDFGVSLSYLILICSLVFLYFYTAFIRKWKSLPE